MNTYTGVNPSILSEWIFKVGFLGIPKSEKPEFTNVNEDFEDEGNAKSTLKKHSEINL